MLLLNCIMNSCSRIYPMLVCLLVGTLLNGCATTEESRLATSNLTVPVKILVVPSPMKIESGRMQKVLTPDAKTRLTNNDEAIIQAIIHSQQFTLNEMTNDLARYPQLISVLSSSPVLPLIGTMTTTIDSKKAGASDTTGVATDVITDDTTSDTANDSMVIPQQLADQIHTLTGADAILHYDITDYGLTPQSWRTGYISFEVASTLAITAIIASAGTSLAKGAAGAYLAQETAEETAESYAGFWALDEVCRPVRIEAELIQLNPVAVVWRGSDTGLADVHLSRLTEKVDDQQRNNQLDQATDYSVKNVVAALVNDLKRIKPAPRNIHTK